MSREVIAIRELEYAAKGKEARCRLTIKVFKPYLLQQGKVSFSFSPGTSGCELEFEGLDTKRFDTVFYGADMLQALQFAADVEPILKRISQDYDLYFETGEPYFE